MESAQAPQVHCRDGQGVRRLQRSLPADPGPLDDCPGWTPLDKIPSGMFTFYLSENKSFLPRAYVVDRVKYVKDVPAAASELVSPKFNPSHEVLWVGTAPKPTPPTPHVTSEARRCPYED